MSLRVPEHFPPTRAELAELRARVSLRLIVEQTQSIDRNRKVRCPAHNDQRPSCHVYDDRWHCFSCGAGGTVLDWVMHCDGVDLTQAAIRLGWSPRRTAYDRAGRNASKRVDGKTGEVRGGLQRASKAIPDDPPAAPVKQSPAWQDPAWQQAVDEIVVEAEQILWSQPGRAALDWLRRRGIDDDVVRRFRLGFSPDWRRSEVLPVLGLDEHGRPRRINCPRGVTIPWLRPGSWYSPIEDPEDPDPAPRWVGLNVRRLADPVDVSLPDKALAVAGSTRGHAYPWDTMNVGVPALICEGELDALIAEQEVGHLVDVLTVGGAKQAPQHDVVERLRFAPNWLLALDADDAGRKGLGVWLGLAPHKCWRVVLPEGQDLTDYHRAGGSLRELIKATLVAIDARRGRT
jgi:hypothetical protein